MTWRLPALLALLRSVFWGIQRDQHSEVKGLARSHPAVATLGRQLLGLCADPSVGLDGWARVQGHPPPTAPENRLPRQPNLFLVEKSSLSRCCRGWWERRGEAGSREPRTLPMLGVPQHWSHWIPAHSMGSAAKSLMPSSTRAFSAAAPPLHGQLRTVPCSSPPLGEGCMNSRIFTEPHLGGPICIFLVCPGSGARPQNSCLLLSALACPGGCAK